MHEAGYPSVEGPESAVCQGQGGKEDQQEQSF